MNDDLINRLEDGAVLRERRWSGDCHTDQGGPVDEEATDKLMAEAAARIRELEAEKSTPAPVTVSEAARLLIPVIKAKMAEIPVGQENPQRGASTYNWWSEFVAELRTLSLAPDTKEQPDE